MEVCYGDKGGVTVAERTWAGVRECEQDFLGPEALAALLEFAYTATLITSSANMLAVFQAA